MSVLLSSMSLLCWLCFRRHCKLLWKGDRSFLPGKKNKPFARTLVIYIVLHMYTILGGFSRPARYVILEFKLEWLFGVILLFANMIVCTFDVTICSMDNIHFGSPYSAVCDHHLHCCHGYN